MNKKLAQVSILVYSKSFYGTTSFGVFPGCNVNFVV
jgi:hypothetical protein